jgi:hypothetical protein
MTCDCGKGHVRARPRAAGRPRRPLTRRAAPGPQVSSRHLPTPLAPTRRATARD